MPPKKPKLDPKKGGKPKLDPNKGGKPSLPKPGTSKDKPEEPSPDDEPEPIFGTSILPQDYGKIT